MKTLALSLLLVAFACVSAFAKPQVAITIDDIALNADDTPLLSMGERNARILQALKANGDLQAALFVCGMRIDNEQGKRLLAEWDKANHLIGNHSYSHFYFPSVDLEKFSKDVARGEAMIAGLRNFRKLFRFPYLKEGNTPEKRDGMRKFLRENGYKQGYVTIDTSEWAIDARLRKRLKQNPQADLKPYRDFYLEHIWERTVFYDDLAKKVWKKPVRHTVLIHHNLVTALFLDDLIKMFRKKGWKVISAEKAFKDRVFSASPSIAPAGESIIWSLAKESGKFDSLLRYPAEDERYERKRMDELGL
jgi:peptidoglycan/xylan/chitin deacetylase (PgdA/CDA1 family)